MGKARPERELVVNAYLENPNRKAYEIAEEAGLVELLGYDQAVDYVRRVKKALKAKGQITVGAYATDEERLEDVTTLFELRNGRMPQKVAYIMLLLNCYYQLRSEDISVHAMAIDDTYRKNGMLKYPFGISEAIEICNAALTQYVISKDEAKNIEARKHGYPGAGLNYSDDRFIERLEITESELKHLKSIKRGGDGHGNGISHKGQEICE